MIGFAIIVWIGVVLLGALGSYISGRIVFPEVGLTAPEYLTWFWTWFWGMALALPFYALKAMINNQD